jgi:hypothetical protein
VGPAPTREHTAGARGGRINPPVSWAARIRDLAALGFVLTLPGPRGPSRERADLLHREHVRCRRLWHCTPEYGTTRHEPPCDRRHTDVLTKILTNRLGKTWGSRQTRRSPAIQDGVSEGTRTPDTQDHNLVL